ncbi:uncharacterized protein [Dysidea avara]|uniref:uncharacterized protein isoform X2 n=1 Tax=Dysidea avara TaxID=196820 RepID=UPI003317814B
MAGIPENAVRREPTDEECDRLKKATEDGNVDDIKTLASSGVDVNTSLGDDNERKTSLHYAAEKNQPIVIKLLQEYGVDINCQDEDGWTPLMCAADEGHTDVVKMLHEFGADINHQNKDGWTPLMCEADEGHTDVVKMLHEFGADINHQDKDGWTPLMCAAGEGHTDVVKILHEFGVDINHQNKDGWTPLMCAADKGHTDVVKMLHEFGADINHQNKNGWTPLMVAANGGHTDVVKMLHEFGADINHQNKDGVTPLMCAANKGHTDVVKMLHEFGADINHQNKNGWTPLMVAANGGHTDVVKMLHEFGADINHQNKYDNTPLHCAAYKGHTDTVKMLYRCGGNIYCEDEDHQTPLHLAVDQKQISTVKYFVEELKMDISKFDEEYRRKIEEMLKDSASQSPEVQKDVESKPSSEDKPQTEDQPTTEDKSPAEEFDQKTLNAYREALKKGSRSSNQFKLVTLGAEGAGKTSTINTLMNEKFLPNQETTVGASISSCKVTRSIATSKWQKITATARVVEIPKQRRGEMKSAMALISLDPTPQSPPVNPIVHQKAIEDLKMIMATQDIKKDETRIIVFDIGGQEVYYEIHFLFLATEDVALLVFKASIGLHTPVSPRQHSTKATEKIAVRGMKTNLQTIEVLLQSVYSRGEEAPKGSISPRVPVVLMIGAHAEDVTTEEKMQMIQEIRKHFYGTPLLEHLPRSPEDCFYFIGNSRPDQRVVNHLRSTIVKAVEWVICIPRPTSYLSFEEKILELKEVRIEKARAVAIAKEAGIEEQNVSAVLGYYTKKGILLYFPELESLKNEVFLLPEEVSDLVCTVITTLDCYPDTCDLQQSHDRYKKYALLEGNLFDFMLFHCKRLKDRNVILGLLEQFSLAAKVPTKTKFPGEECLSEPSEVYMVPSLLVYDQANELRAKQTDDIAIAYYFRGKFLPEAIFNKLLVRTIHWCCGKKHHEVKCINRGFGYFLLERGVWQSFKLQLCQSAYCIKCFITIHHHESQQPPDDLLKQRQDLLCFLTASIKELSKPHMPDSKLPVTCLECPFHEDDHLPHIPLDITKKEMLVCKLGSSVQLINENYYKALYESIKSAPPKTGAIDCAKTAQKLIGAYNKLIKLPIKSMLPQLYCNKVITEGQKKKIEVKELESDGMQCFLDEVLILSLELDMTEIYNKFIKILEDSDDLIQRGMAKKIGPSS